MMNPYVNVTDPNLYGQYYSMGQTQHAAPHNNYATYYNPPYPTTHNNNAASNVVATATGQYTAPATTIPAYGTQSRGLLPNSSHNSQRALTFHPASVHSISNMIKQSEADSEHPNNVIGNDGLPLSGGVTIPAAINNNTVTETNKNNEHVPTNEECGIREVWASNIEDEFRTISKVAQNHYYIAMDTEFPGVVARPVGEFKSNTDYQYQLIRCNVDLLKIIQIGLSLFDEKGNVSNIDGIKTWQFNFAFNIKEDMYAEDSVELLRNSGINFEKHDEDGIYPEQFAQYMIASGLVLVPEAKWLAFHSSYDFAYLLHILTNKDLPQTEKEFFDTIHLYFPTIYDLKYLMTACKNLKGGLQDTANQLDIARVGPQHQAGSDALLTGQLFFKMKHLFFEDKIDDARFAGHMFGIGSTSFNPPPGWLIPPSHNKDNSNYSEKNNNKKNRNCKTQ